MFTHTALESVLLLLEISVEPRKRACLLGFSVFALVLDALPPWILVVTAGC